MNILVPTQLETERLILRQFNDSDWQSLHRYFSNRDATQYTLNREVSELESWYMVCSMIGHWQLRGYGPYALEHKETKAVVGLAGFWYPLDWPGPEIKWALVPEFCGKGYASEAARAVQTAGKQYLPDISLISIIHDENAPSIKLAESVGATLDGKRFFRNAWWRTYRH